MSARTNLCALAALLAAGCADPGAPPGGSGAPSPAPAFASLRAAADQPELLAGPGQASVSLATTHFLFVRFEVPGELPAPVAWVTLRLYTPTGALYLERHVPFSTALELTRTSPRHGEPHEVNVVRAQPTAAGHALDLPILVGGSNLQRRPQPGVWTISAALDDHPEVAARSTLRFVAP